MVFLEDKPRPRQMPDRENEAGREYSFLVAGQNQNSKTHQISVQHGTPPQGMMESKVENTRLCCIY